MSDLKTCTKCKVEKQKTEFSKAKKSKDGLQSKCKECSAAYYAKNKELLNAKALTYRAENKEAINAKNREYYSSNADAINERHRAYYAANTESVAVLHRAYYLANTEASAAKSRKWYAENPDRASELRRMWREANPERAANLCRKWRAANPEKSAAIGRNRRARVSIADGSHTASDVKAIFESQRGRCANCPKKLVKSGKNRYHVDHIQPISKGGSNDKYNLQCLCPECNIRKHAKDPLDWASENGRLL